MSLFLIIAMSTVVLLGILGICVVLIGAVCLAWCREWPYEKGDLR